MRERYGVDRWQLVGMQVADRVLDRRDDALLVADDPLEERDAGCEPADQVRAELLLDGPAPVAAGDELADTAEADGVGAFRVLLFDHDLAVGGAGPFRDADDAELRAPTATGGVEVAKGAEPAEKVWVGFDLGGTKMNAVLFDRKFEAIARRKKKTRGADGATAGVERIRATIEKLLEEGLIEPVSLEIMVMNADGSNNQGLKKSRNTCAKYTVG